MCFGFDTAARTYAEIVGNLCQDARSTRIYYHFVRIMGRRAGHLTLEVANRTKPNVALIGEEISAKGCSRATSNEVATLVADRANLGLNHGVVLVELLALQNAELMENSRRRRRSARRVPHPQAVPSRSRTSRDHLTFVGSRRRGIPNIFSTRC